MEIVEDFMNKLETNVAVLFDGIPRKTAQAELLNQLLDKHGRKYRGVLLDINQETALKRLTTRRICKDCKAVYPSFYDKDTCQECNGELITRADDNADAIKKRLEVYAEETVPAMELYKDGLITISGENSIEEVQTEAFEKLEPVIN